METSTAPPAYEEATGFRPLESRRPSVHLRTIVETYMLSRQSGLDGSMHKALNTNDFRVTLDPARHKWVETEVEESEDIADLEPLYKDVEGDEKVFLEAMKEYESKAEPKYKVGINMEATHSMDDVIAAIADAQMAYDEKERKGFFAPLRRAFRILGDNQEVCKAWLGLLPGDSEYFSIICGGLKLILGAAKRLRKINEDIVDALVRIPEILSKSRRVLVINKVSLKLQNFSSALYVAVLHAMGHILQYYRELAVIRHVGVFAKQDSFQRTLLEKIGAITRCSSAIDREAELRGMELAAETNKVAKKAERISEALYEKTGEIKEQSQEVYERAGDIQHSVESLRRTWSSDTEAREKAAIEREEEAAKQREELLEIVNNQNDKIEQQCQALNSIADLLAKSPQLKDMQEVRNKITPYTTPQKANASKTASPNTSPKLLLSRLHYDKEIPRIDMRANLQLALSLSLEDQDQAVYMMKSQHLQNWLRTPKSSILLVDGGARGSGSQLSPLGFVCAKLANALRQARGSFTSSSETKIINLYFFCGEHRDWRDNPDNGPAGVMNSLLAQLLTQYKHFDLSLIKHLSTLDSGDTKALANIFGKLLTQLPSKMIVFCIIDGVSFYDDEERSEVCQILLKKLVSFSRRHERKGAGVFKLLLTAPLGLRVAVVDELDEEEILRIPEGLGKGGGFTDMNWDIGAGKDIADLSKIQRLQVVGS